ncbi:MAG: hypothetical protein EA369_03780 [Bradymonadales bacterium]|nr:MAG: hypothetical protein EA369_03780 [Bradymonadales bacterium]
MFELSSPPFVDLQKEKLLQLYQSLNQPVLSPEPGLPAETAQAYFILSLGQGEKLHLYIGLCFLDSSHRILYKSEAFSDEEMVNCLVEAESFVGEMGFMMDDLHFQDGSEAERREMKRTNPFFYREHSQFLEALTRQEKAEKVSKAPLTQRQTGSQKYSFFLEHYVRMLSML